MTAIQNDIIERPHRFALSKAIPLQAVVRRLANGESVEDGDTKKLNPEFFADLIDFSNKGLKLSLPFQATFQERLTVRLELDEVDYFYEAVGVVRHIRMDGARWVAGCSIEPNLPDFLVDYLAHTAGKDRRRHPRCLVAGLGYFKREGDTHGTPAEFTNLSESGFSAKIAYLPLIGERVMFLVYDKVRNLKQITACIRWTKKAEDEDAWFIGASFVDKSDYRHLKSAFLVQSPDHPILLKRDYIGWYVVAACLLCMLIPPLTSIAYQSVGHPKNIGQTDSVEPKLESTVKFAGRSIRPSIKPTVSKPPRTLPPDISELPFESTDSKSESKPATLPFLIVDDAIEDVPLSIPNPNQPSQKSSSRRSYSDPQPEPNQQPITISSRRVD